MQINVLKKHSFKNENTEHQESDYFLILNMSKAHTYVIELLKSQEL